MKNVLFVDDEETLLRIMIGRFEDYKDRFDVLTAGNGKEAIEILESKTIDLVVTDLKMPVVDGVELLAYMSANYPSIPAITVSAFCTPKIQKMLEKMGTLRVMDKPVNLDLLAQAVIEGLDHSHQGGSLSCVSLSSFLQIIEMEEKTCMLEVHGEGPLRGYLYMVQGELYDATCGVLQKEEAAYAMIAWDNVQLYIKDLPKEKPKKRIEKGLMSVVMEGLKRKDELNPVKESDSPEPESAREITEESLMAEFDRALEGFEEEPITPIAKKSTIDQSPAKPKAEDQVTFSGKIFNITHSNASEGKLLRALMTELQSIVTVDLAVLMSQVKNKPEVFRIEDLVVDGSTSIRKGAVYSFQDTSIFEVMKHRNPLIIKLNGSVSCDFEKQLFESHGINSYLCVPILTGDTVSRILVLGAKRTANFSEAGGYVDWIASGLSMAMERNRLSSTVMKQKQALSAAYQIGLALVSRNYDVEKVFNLSMEHIRKIMNVEAGTLYLKEKDQLKIATAFNTKIDAVKKYRLKIGQGVAGYVAAKGKTMVENDTEKSSQFFQEIDKLTGFKTRSVLCVPLFSQRKVIGYYRARVVKSRRCKKHIINVLKSITS
jgi:CheY-like chemotaxis protein/putative methionine-R-sulfoxide reductase with GAF domain